MNLSYSKNLKFLSLSSKSHSKNISRQNKQSSTLRPLNWVLFHDLWIGGNFSECEANIFGQKYDSLQSEVLRTFWRPMIYGKRENKSNGMWTFFKQWRTRFARWNILQLTKLDLEAEQIRYETRMGDILI